MKREREKEWMVGWFENSCGQVASERERERGREKNMMERKKKEARL